MRLRTLRKISRFLVTINVLFVSMAMLCVGFIEERHDEIIFQFLGPALSIYRALIPERLQTLGNVPIGLGGLFFSIMAYAFLGAAVVQLAFWISCRRPRGKSKGTSLAL